MEYAIFWFVIFRLWLFLWRQLDVPLLRPSGEKSCLVCWNLFPPIDQVRSVIRPGGACCWPPRSRPCCLHCAYPTLCPRLCCGTPAFNYIFSVFIIESINLTRVPWCMWLLTTKSFPRRHNGKNVKFGRIRNNFVFICIFEYLMTPDFSLHVTAVKKMSQATIQSSQAK